ERDEDDDDNDDEEELAEKDDEDTESDRGDDEVSESERESDEEETRQEEEESFDPIPKTPEGNSHVTLTLVQPDGPQESSSVSSFVTNMLNPISDAGVESIFTTTSSPIVSLQTPTPIMTASTIATITTSSDAPIPPTTIPSTILENLPTFNSVFRFDERLRSLETTFSEYRQTNPFVNAVSAILENDEFLRNIDENMKKIIKGHVKSQVKEQVTRILPRIEESVNATLEAEVLTRSSYSSRTSYAIGADLSEMELKKILIEKMEGNKSIQREDDDQEGPSAGSDRGSKRRRERGEHASASTPSETATGSTGRSTTGSQSRQLSASADDQPIVQTSQHPEWFSQPRRPPSPDGDWNKTLLAVQGDAQSWISVLARQTDAHSSFNELLDTLIDFSNFIMNRLGVDTLTPELLAGPTYELMRGSCQQYPDNLQQPLPLIPDNRGRRVIPFDHFINNDLEYLRGGTLSRKYTTSVTKTKAADYGHIKWIEDLVPRAMWIQQPINYDRHALWGVSHWGRKRQQFYGYAVNQESALDVYSKRRIIAVTELKIVE
nr:hypothetical protein [Tanacetum cinerariifolium]